MRALVQIVVPYGSLVDTSISALAARFRRIRAERARVFYDELAAGAQVLTPQVVESEEFLHNHLATVQAAVNTRRHEKVQWFARLLLGTAGDRPGVGADEFEDYLSMLDDLSYRELCLLATLAEFEAAYPGQAEENDVQRTNRFWSTFAEVACRRCVIPPDELDGALHRLNRSGAYLGFEGGFYDYTGNRGSLSPAYYRLADLIRLRPEVFSRDQGC